MSDLTVRYGATSAVTGVSLEVPAGAVVGLIGPNGAGKTSLVDAVSGLTARSGEVYVGPIRLTSATAPEVFKAGVARSFQSVELFDDLSVRENIAVAAQHQAARRNRLRRTKSGPDSDDVALAAITELKLNDCLDTLARELSFGRRRLVGIARAIASRPSVLLLDEPAAGLDGVEVAELMGLIRRLATDWGMGILLVEHHIEMVVGVCDSLYVLVSGQVIAHGTPGEVIQDAAVVSAYLGAGRHASYKAMEV